MFSALERIYLKSPYEIRLIKNICERSFSRDWRIKGLPLGKPLISVIVIFFQKLSIAIWFEVFFEFCYSVNCPNISQKLNRATGLIFKQVFESVNFHEVPDLKVLRSGSLLKMNSLAYVFQGFSKTHKKYQWRNYLGPVTETAVFAGIFSKIWQQVITTWFQLTVF